jgi:hypothetical protein
MIVLEGQLRSGKPDAGPIGSLPLRSIRATFFFKKRPFFLNILGHRFMHSYNIFIYSPGDVGRERHLAERVIRRVAAKFKDRVEVQPYFWEYKPMQSTPDYQENIPISEFDLVICILWKQLGGPLNAKNERPDNEEYRRCAHRL